MLETVMSFEANNVVSTRLVSFPAEMFNDALFFLEEAKKLDLIPENDWLRWRYLRASILYSFACLEAYVNSFIADYLNGVLKLTEVAKNFKDARISIERKIDTVFAILIRKPIDKSRKEWEYFKTINTIRNRLAHYSGGTAIYNDRDKYGVNIANAEKGILMARIMVKYLKQLAGEKYPPWVDQVDSKVIR
jgi:hypothetical protein